MTLTLARFLIGLWIGIGLAYAVSPEVTAALTLQKSSSGHGIILTLPNSGEGFASFLRQGYFWLALPSSTSLTLNVKQLPSGFSKPERVQTSKGTLLRLRIPRDVFPVIKQENESSIILLNTRSQKNPLPAHMLPVDILKVDLKEKTACIDRPQSQVLTFQDPVTHHTLFIVPVPESGAGFPARLFKRDFSLLPTIQGLVVEANPHVTVRETEKNLYISKVGGLNLSPSSDLSFAHTEEKPLTRILTPLQKTRIATLQRLIPQAKGRLRIELEWELIHQQIMDEQATEALANLDILAKKYPAWERLQAFQVLRGTALFLKNQLASAFYTFSNPFCGTQTGPMLLATRLKNGEIAQALTLLEKRLDEVHLLPQPFQGNVLLLAAQAAIYADMSNRSLQFLRALPKNLTSEQKKYADNLMKQVVFEPLLPGPPSQSEVPELTKPRPYLRHEANVQTRLETLLVAHKVGRVNDKKLIQQLEKIKWESKSPTFESQILKLLGMLYDKENLHLKSLDYYRAFLRRYPKDPEHKAIQEKAVISYHDAILDPNLPFVRKLALFRKFPEFLEHAPEKLRLVQTIASEMVEHHLTDEAAALISQALASEVDPYLLLQLAEIYLLNQQPKHVLKLLNHFVDKFSLLEKNTVNLLKARALGQEGKYDQALALIPHDDQKTHILQRAALLVQKKDWSHAATEYQKVMDLGETPTPLLEQLAVCLYQSNRLEDLKKFFTPENLNKSSFLKILSQTLLNPSPKDLKELRTLLQSLPQNLAL